MSCSDIAMNGPIGCNNFAPAVKSIKIDFKTREVFDDLGNCIGYVSANLVRNVMAGKEITSVRIYSGKKDKVARETFFLCETNGPAK